MKASVLETLPQTQAILAEKSWLAVFADLVKARLTSLVLLTTLVGFYLGSAPGLDYPLMTAALLGTALLASGAAALNQLLEREYDGRMERTKDRPLPSGRLQPRTVFIIGVTCVTAGLGCLLVGVNVLTAWLGLLTAGIYLLIYTPIKRVSWFNTLIGAIPGALPPLMGWTAARGELGEGGWTLFAILFFWQIPHFMAIAWLYREDYARAGFQMLPVVDRHGVRTGRQAVTHAGALLVASVLPAMLAVAGTVYLAGALLLGGIFLALAVRFAGARTRGRARALFLMSITYLPILLILLVLDKIRH